MREWAVSGSKLSAVVIAQDEEHRIVECLRSLQFADEIVVVDGGSRDSTMDRAREAGAKVLEHPFVGWRTARAVGLEAAAGDWVLSVDADERVTPALAKEIIATLSVVSDTLGGFRIPMKTYYRQRWLRHGGFWPARRLRLFRRRGTRYAPDREVHEQVLVSGRVSRLHHAIEHHSFESFGDAMRRAQRYATFAAADLAARGVRAGAIQAGARALVRFVRSYFLRAGFLDGVPGLWFAALGAYETLAKYATLWERAQLGPSHDDPGKPPG